MRNSVPAEPDPSLRELRRALEAMREAGWLMSAPTTPAADTSEPCAPAPGLHEESR
ncbi:hypothetical protein AB0H20_21725 [Nocardia fluminea]|uniref:hypothetical protein n=1 Tax=Nocardia fluminea TaxID=134984 RepID=UPI0033D5C09D